MYAPTAISVSGITSSGASINFTSGNSIVEYSTTSGFTAGTGATAGSGSSSVSASGSSPISLTGLSANTTYYYVVRQDCSGVGYSTNSAQGSFKTACATITTLPFVETFESTSTTRDCWTVIDGNTDADLWTLTTVNPYAGTQAYRLYTDYNASNQDYLISPKLTLTGNQRLKFWTRANSTSEVDEISVKISTTGNAIANFTATAMASTTISGSVYTEYIVNLSAYSTDVYIAFVRENAPADGWYIYIDNVTVENIPSCLVPTAISASSITTSGASINFTSASNSIVEYSTTSGFTAGTGATAGSGSSLVSTSGASPIALTGLTANTTYYYVVRQDCGVSGFSTNSAQFSFKTPAQITCGTTSNFTHCYGNI